VIVFTGASAYIALRAGSGIEASIPVAILAIFFGSMRKFKSTILENVMVQSVGQAAGVVAAGATFVIPALYINELEASWWQIFLACGVGGCLGTALIIPLRKYFVKDLHGELPFPEATAINEVLVAGESSAGGAGKILILAFCLGASFDFLVEAMHLWNAELTTDVLPWGIGEGLAGLRIEIQIAGIAALFGLGMIIGVKYSSIIAAGSVLAMLVMVPLVYYFGKDLGSFAFSGKAFDIGQMDSSAIFGNFIKPIGIGAIAISGLIGIIRMGKIVVNSVTLGFKGLSRQGGGEAAQERTQLDLAPKNVLLIQLAASLAMGVLFFIVASTTCVAGESYGAGDSLLFAVVGMGVVFLLSFLFTPVAAQAIAIVGVNPVSGMTLITVVDRLDPPQPAALEVPGRIGGGPGGRLRHSLDGPGLQFHRSHNQVTQRQGASGAAGQHDRGNGRWFDGRPGRPALVALCPGRCLRDHAVDGGRAHAGLCHGHVSAHLHQHGHTGRSRLCLGHCQDRPHQGDQEIPGGTSHADCGRPDGRCRHRGPVDRRPAAHQCRGTHPVHLGWCRSRSGSGCRWQSGFS
jgi:hypothetical protein